MSKLTADQARNLASQFHDISVAVGNYRFDNWDALTSAKRDRLEDLQWTLMNYSSDFTSQAISLTLSDLAKTLDHIQRTTKKAKQVIQTIKTVDKVIRIAAAATVLAAAIMTGNAEAAIKAAEDTYEQATN
jgi:paraquat-inducible protein B